MRQKTLSQTRLRTSISSRAAILAAVLAAALYLALSCMQVSAAEGFHLYTDTPGIRVTAGDSVSFDLHLSGANAAGKDLGPFLGALPQGVWGGKKKRKF